MFNDVKGFNEALFRWENLCPEDFDPPEKDEELDDESDDEEEGDEE